MKSKRRVRRFMAPLTGSLNSKLAGHSEYTLTVEKSMRLGGRDQRVLARVSSGRIESVLFH